MKNQHTLTVVGGGLAGSEAAYLAAKLGFQVKLYEMRPQKNTPAHQTDNLGELVCSNSLGSKVDASAGQALKNEMRALGSLVLEAASEAEVPCGNALGVNRDIFAAYITGAIAAHPNISILREELTEIPEHEMCIIATGPLTSEALSESLAKHVGQESLYFYDSISPIVMADSIDLSQAYFGNRYEEDAEDYLNCPLDQATYEAFVAAIDAAEKVDPHNFEELKCFEGCMPVEVLVSRGKQTLAFGPMKPVGLIDPRNGKRPYAVLQLRRENQPTTMYNLVGFQTRMKWGEQKRVFKMIPALKNAEFVRMGSMHRNTYLQSPELLDAHLRLKQLSHVRIAGQLTGVEGYVESAAMGQWAALSAVSELSGLDILPPPQETAMGALLKTITQGPQHGQFAPMNMNFGIWPPLPTRIRNKKERRLKMIQRSRASFENWLKDMSLITQLDLKVA